MKTILEKKDFFGSLKISVSEEKGLFLIEPKGIINPGLVLADLKAAHQFGSEYQKPWIYIVNTENVLFPNPLNLFYLSRIKELPFISEYIVYAPSFVVRLLGSLTNLIIKPDQVLKNTDDLKSLLS
jgi:hypothetical protein